ncbi:ABC transporter substrate-binding protein [Pseudomonas sp. UL073]|uniref:ABC transporter substrate-binding protein n=1 Tax=Zestomonas insulae TaxID=2809017 RepID=A0ABS2I7S3_9GAMM|nr:ABC transporter substrate-binding protein [Pseudomonas insulae]MBM7059201.1 ABC transporter substrate-binding protein [Pseudomonas insulae]
MARLALLLCLGLAVGPALGLTLSDDEAAGKRLFVEGVSLSGGEVLAKVGAGATVLPASALPCASCHGADGRGRPEGGVRPPDITWRRLTTHYGQQINGRSYPPYGEDSLAQVVSDGVDPAGNRLDTAMPRFVLSPRDMARLTAYLKRLEDDHDPGLESDRLRVGTLLPSSGVLADHSRTVGAVLQGMIDALNRGGGIHGRQLELVVADPGPDRASAEQALQRLLDEQHVFALLAPLAPALEGRLDALLGAAGVPVIGSLAQFAEGDSGRAIFAPLPGLREQVLVLANFASELLPTGPRRALLVYQADAGLQPLADQLAERLRRQGWSAVEVHDYRPAAAGAALQGQAAQTQALFFLGSQDAFVTMSDSLPADDGSPPYLFAIATQVAGAALQVPPRYADRLFLAYPFLLDDWTPDGTAALATLRQSAGLNGRHGALQVSAYCAALLFFEGMKRAGRDASRERLVSALENLHGFQTGLTPELGFGPGMRVGATGAHIVSVDLQANRFRPLGRYVKPASPF